MDAKRSGYESLSRALLKNAPVFGLVLAPRRALAAQSDLLERLPEWLSSADTMAKLRNIGAALLILFIGWIVARVVAFLVFKLLHRTKVDNKLADKLGVPLGERAPGGDEASVERVISRLVFYLLMLFAIIAALDYGGFSATAAPLQAMMATIAQALPLVGKAGLILIVAYFTGLILQKLIAATLARANLDSWIARVGGVDDTNRRPFSQAAGSLMFWLVMFIGLAGAFEALKIEVLAGPLSNMLNQALMLLPALGVAALILLGGYILGRLARAVVKNLLQSLGFDRLMDRMRLKRLFQQRTPSDVAGLAAMVFILLHALIAACHRLGLETLSGPLTAMIDKFWSLLPSLFVSVIILAVGVVAARIVRDLIQHLLQSLGFDGYLERLGLDLRRLSRADSNVDKEPSHRRIEKPSELVAALAQLALVLVAIAQVLDHLELTVWAEVVRVFLSQTFLNAMIALAIVGVGLAIGNYVRELIQARGSEGDQSWQWIGGAARVAVLAFAFTMAIQQLKFASTFVLLTFGLVFGALCLALALAFGLGGRAAAADIITTQYDKTRRQP